jgi:hypothetical protein
MSKFEQWQASQFWKTQQQQLGACRIQELTCVEWMRQAITRMKEQGLLGVVKNENESKGTS